MQIVIDIPEVIYGIVKETEPRMEPTDFMGIVVNAIANGTPIPKGHGRIADMDEAIKCIEEVEGEDAIYAIALIDWACSKRTILEADKKVRDKN